MMFDFYERKLLPMIVTFIQNHLSWQIVANHNHDRQSILNLFEKEVVAKANEIILTAGKETKKWYIW